MGILNKKAGYTVLIIGFFLVGFYFGLQFFADEKALKETKIDTSEWVTYTNDEFGFKIKHPSDWILSETEDFLGPAFNIYPQSIGDSIERLPLIHHSHEPNVSIFPHGVPTEGVSGKTEPSIIEFTEKPTRAMDFVLENGNVWATFAGYQYGPDNWNESGFLWARAEVEGFESRCLRDGEEIDINSCDYLTSDDRIAYSGEVNKTMRAIEEEILKSFEFTVQTTGDLINVTAPQAGQVIESPFIVKGEARGNWYFEATFPMTLTNWNGEIITEWYAEAQDEWMTTDFVPFEGILEFENPSSEEDFTKNGYLILHKSNASGLPEHDDAIEIPVRFK